jgi:hypothetical protein
MKHIQIIKSSGYVIEQFLYNIGIHSIHLKKKTAFFKVSKAVIEVLLVHISSVTNSRQKQLTKDIKKV